MNLIKKSSLPNIIWIAARAPVPPFSGTTGKTLCGINVLSSETNINLVTFSNLKDIDSVSSDFNEYWKNKSISLHLLNFGDKSGFIRALIFRKFLFGNMIESSSLFNLLNELEWGNPKNILLFDDIILSPLIEKFGSNAILSPHDCMSSMFKSHFKNSLVGLKTFRYYYQYIIAKRYEQRFYHKALLIHLITQRDRILLERINSSARYHVIPNADLLNPGFHKNKPNKWDIMIWGDLRIGSIVRGAKEFLRLISEDSNWKKEVKIILIGRVALEKAKKIIGRKYLYNVTYSPFLEDENGQVRHAKITVIPDIGGAGMKNRCVNILATGKCLACLYHQMEGIEEASDIGAINGVDTRELLKKVRSALDENLYREIGEKGYAIYQEKYDIKKVRKLWIDMICRALSLRSWLFKNLSSR
ncbi:MAG: hypothetical protein ACTSRG_24545 [Candidatus Helarchaeota archaeon]